MDSTPKATKAREDVLKGLEMAPRKKLRMESMFPGRKCRMCVIPFEIGPVSHLFSETNKMHTEGCFTYHKLDGITYGVRTSMFMYCLPDNFSSVIILMDEASYHRHELSISSMGEREKENIDAAEVEKVDKLNLSKTLFIPNNNNVDEWIEKHLPALYPAKKLSVVIGIL